MPSEKTNSELKENIEENRFKQQRIKPRQLLLLLLLKWVSQMFVPAAVVAGVRACVRACVCMRVCVCVCVGACMRACV